MLYHVIFNPQRFIKHQIDSLSFSGCVAYNLGTGRGTSVLEMVKAFEKVVDKVRMTFNFTMITDWSDKILIGFRIIFQKIPIKLCPRRLGDATAVYASTEKAQKELGWK